MGLLGPGVIAGSPLNTRSIRVIEVDSEEMDLGRPPMDNVLALHTESWKDELTLVMCSRNLGYAGGMNMGIRYARSTYGKGSCLLLNNDVTLREGIPPRGRSFRE